MVGFGLDYACAHIIILAEISSENLLPIRADFVTERDTEPCFCIVITFIITIATNMGHYVFSPFQIDDRDEISVDDVSEDEDRPAVQLRDSIYTATG